MIAAFPLQWPTGWQRMRSRKSANFSTYKRSLSVADGVERVVAELGRYDVARDDMVISTNLRLRMDGFPRSDQPEPEDPGVAVYWQEHPIRTDGGGGPHRVMAIDIYTRVADNLAAIAATLAAMRAIERHGGAAILERAFTGFTALPNPDKQSWRDVLGIKPNAEVSGPMIDAAFRRLASSAHPDKGGSADAMSKLNRAREEALREIAQ